MPMVTPSRQGSPRTTPDGFGYRIVYVAPARIHEAARAICGRPCALPFVREPVTANETLASTFDAAFRLDPEPLEEVTGLTRYDIARQFRSAFGASPYRYSLMRCLDRARAQLRWNRSLADVALAAGVADQAHLSRMFKYAFGVTPARYRALGDRDF
jgi:AraC-like DNA-binding protein